jgi:RNA polymerase sigma-70 factor (ECF subfamily)
MGSATDQKFREWAQRIRASDEDAFAEFFRAIYSQMVKFAWRYTRSESDAHDVVQESFVKLWKLRENVDPNQSLRAYLYQIVRSRALNYLRDKKDHTSIEDTNQNTLKVQNKVLANVLENENYDKKMGELISELPDRQREAMELSRFEGLNHDEIADVMQISPRTVNNHIVAALKTLRKEWTTFKNNKNG